MDTIRHKDGRYLMCKGDLGVDFGISWEADCIGIDGHHVFIPSEKGFILLDDEFGIPVNGMTVSYHPKNEEDAAKGDRTHANWNTRDRL